MTGARVEYWPARAYVVISIGVWAVTTALIGWGMFSLDGLGQPLGTILAVVVTGVFAALAVARIRGMLAGPSLIADADGLIWRDGVRIWGPVPWGQVERIVLGEARGNLALTVAGPVRCRSLIGLRWLTDDKMREPGMLWIPSHSLDSRGAEAYERLTALHEAHS